jgi:hypothetical protein
MMFSEKRQLRRKFNAEIDVAAVYDALAEAETNSELRRRYQEKAWHERERAAGIWIRLWSEGAAVPTWKTTLRGKWLSALARRFSGFEQNANADAVELQP